MSSESLLERIKKLLSLAGEANASREEAALALAKAQQLMLLHQIDVMDLQEKPAPDDFSKQFVGQPYNRAAASQKYIVWLLQEPFHVRAIFYPILGAQTKTPLYVKKLDKRYRQFIKIPEYAGMKGNEGMQFVGRKSNLLIAQYASDFLTRGFERLWKQHQQETGKAAYSKLDFFQGLYHGLNERLTDERRRTEREATPEQQHQFSIVKVDEENALNDYIGQEFPSLRHASKSGYRERRDVDSYAKVALLAPT
jgi:hypothetical protein